MRVTSTATAKSDGSFSESIREAGENNSAWVGRQLHDLSATEYDGPPESTYVLLLGGRGPGDFRLRVAQSRMRHDLTPSHWSHAALLHHVESPVGRSTLIESSLEPAGGLGSPAIGNGLQAAFLDVYSDPEVIPNIAILRLPVDSSVWTASAREDHLPLLEQFSKQREILDVPEMMIQWLGFLWGVRSQGNPLLEGVGIPSAATIETLLSAAGYDLCPGLDSRASSPEAFWQTARWWHPYYVSQQIEPIQGRWCVADRMQHLESAADVAAPPRPPAPWLSS